MGKLSNFGQTISLFATCFFIIGFVHDSPLMYVIMLFSVAVLIAAGIFTYVSLRGIECRRETIGLTVFSGDPLEETVQLIQRKNRWRMLELLDLYTNQITGKIVRRRMTLMTEGGRKGGAITAGNREPIKKLPDGSSVVEIKDIIRFAQRGHYRLGPITIQAHDPFGLISQTRTFETRGEVIVYPRPLPIPELVLGGAGARQQMEVHPLTRAGQSADFHGIRPYSHGDDLRRVHWKSTAHTGKLAIKEFEYRSSGSVEVILDLEHGIHVGEGEFSTLEASITLAASVINHVVRAGNQVGLLATSAKLVRLQHESGQQQLHRALETLALANDDGTVSLSQALTSDETPVSRRSTAIVITPSVDIKLINSLLTLRGRAGRVLLVLLNPHSFEQAEKEPEEKSNSLFSNHFLRRITKFFGSNIEESSLFREEDHRNLLHAAAASGIEVYPIGADTPLHQALQGIRMRM